MSDITMSLEFQVQGLHQWALLLSTKEPRLECQYNEKMVGQSEARLKLERAHWEKEGSLNCDVGPPP